LYVTVVASAFPSVSDWPVKEPFTTRFENLSEEFTLDGNVVREVPELEDPTAIK
jgi:hypothetical protein